MRFLSSFYFDATKIAVQSILAHKLRAFLTLIGIIIGVASVVVVGAAISGLNTYVMDRIGKVLGVNHFMIARMAHQGELSEDDWEKMNRRNKRLEWDDYEWLRANCASCSEVGAQYQTRIDTKHAGKQLFRTQIQGVTANMAEIEDKTIADGRFVLPHEVDQAALVVVIGDELREKFFEGVDPLGKTFSLRGIPLRIIGIEEKRGTMFGQSLDNLAYIPVSTYNRIFGSRQSLQIHGKAANAAIFPAAIEDARAAMRNHHKLEGNDEDDFGLVDTSTLNSSVDSFTGAIAMVVTPITLISLVVGGIVVMNIMLVSVTERTFEVGLRKAIGATRRQILLQFLIESCILCGMGGALGLLFAAVISRLISATTPIPMTITVVYILLSLVVSSVIGVVAGIYPAFKAARLDPILALTKN
ncbi:MAG TPA: ABC transporter permease [Pyrinomonadaceae bacterium]|jgi:putative ABC transport system permease protein|nr:ABC transporter permease [Pyrinomonadaceae bacterium]